MQSIFLGYAWDGSAGGKASLKKATLNLVSAQDLPHVEGCAGDSGGCSMRDPLEGWKEDRVVSFLGDSPRHQCLLASAPPDVVFKLSIT